MSGPIAVLDATAVVAWVFDERGADRIDAALPKAAISAVNLAEVLYNVKEANPAADIAQLEDDLKAMGLAVIPFTEEHAREIPRIRASARALAKKQPKVTGTPSLADCACIATGLVLGITVVTDDGLWGALELGRPFRSLPFR